MWNNIFATEISPGVLSAPGTSIPLDQTDLSGLGLSSEDIDARLIYLAAIPTLNETIDIRGNDPRTSASDAAVLTLVTNGCQILEDV